MRTRDSRKRTTIGLTGPIHTMPEKFENRGFALKRHQIFSVHTTSEEFKNATITGYFGFVFEENSARKVT